MKKIAILTPYHIKLINKMWVDWRHGETGAPGIDSKRPYGNSNVAKDVADILDVEGEEEDFNLSEKQESKMLEFHHETQQALQIVLSSKSFEPGIYFGKHTKWELIETFSSPNYLANCLVHPEKEVRDYAQKILKGRT